MPKPISIADAAVGIRDGSLRPIDMVDRCLEQILRHDDRLHAWVLVDEENARRTAQALARQSPLGPLHGVPLGIKDIVDVAGLPTRAGSPLRENHLARSDAPIVAALRRAGAVILGKTVTVEFACFDPSPTLNPWDPAGKHTPGGSSSGSAVAVAMGMCLGAIGTQTGGSLVRPSSYCGVAACKPTFGRLSTEGVVPVSYHLDHPGPIARRVDDLAVLMQCLLEEDKSSPPAAPRRPRLGLLEGFFLEGADEAIRSATETALEKLRRDGMEVRPVDASVNFDDVLPNHRRIMAAEAAAYHRRQFTAHRQAYGPLITGLLDEGLATSAVDYADALAWQRDFRRRVLSLFESFDVLISPATDTTAPATLATTGTPKFQAPWSCAGMPVVSIPCGLAGDGMPAALQLVSPPGTEAMLLDTAGACQRSLAFDVLPPPMT